MAPTARTLDSYFSQNCGHWQSDFMFVCTNVPVDIEFYLQKTHNLEEILFQKYNTCLQ
jgi:L-asparaginase II